MAVPCRDQWAVGELGIQRNSVPWRVPALLDSYSGDTTATFRYLITSTGHMLIRMYIS